MLLDITVTCAMQHAKESRNPELGVSARPSLKIFSPLSSHRHPGFRHLRLPKVSFSPPALSTARMHE